ncbi:hypothetical protein QCA50_000531 [Cerrena zonata]|uniref:Uncharacterized protein n=1 Tax=Cerrena zonata TaxID=2478898 RepID=A0AAW0GZ72_9APHY
MELIVRLQEVIHPDIFEPKGVYDGRKNMFSIRRYPFENDTRIFDVTLGDTIQGSPGGTVKSNKGPKVYKIKLAKVAEINPEVLSRFLQGNQSHDNTVLTAITALNVVVRMEPTIRYPFNVRSFFTNQEKKEIKNSGLVLWRGYFQSVRPAIGRMLINIDISTGTMYKPGSLISLCLLFLKSANNVQALSRTVGAAGRGVGISERDRLALQRFISGIRVMTTGANQQGRPRTPRVVKKISAMGASSLTFTLREGGTLTVAQYFQRTYNRPLAYPDVLCVEVGNGALIPMELCTVVEGQIMRKQVPSETTREVLEFSTKKPSDRLASIARGLGVLSYGQSEYVRQFGLHVRSIGPLTVPARVLIPPTLRYRGKNPSVAPDNGQWNMLNRQFYRPATVSGWVVVVLEREQKFGTKEAAHMVKELTSACEQVGIKIPKEPEIETYTNGQGQVHEQLNAAGLAMYKKKGTFPNLMVVVLPEAATDIYTAVKYFGDIKRGVATQCMKATKCGSGNAQYFANICLKINVKLGGINTIPDPASVRALTDDRVPTIVMGADVIHPAAHTEGRPSFTALVANVDSDTAKYIAKCHVQTSRQEMIDDLKDMAMYMIRSFMSYREKEEKKPNKQPKRIIFYRDGVSEGQFKQVLEYELPQLKAACEALKVNPAITIIVVGKRHHVRFFPKAREFTDRSGNCKAGTVVDSDITHPLEMDFYLQSHGGLLGTSRPAHYNVLYDENNFTPDNIQSLSFALCHVYARSTRSVSIPAPVYYADIVCSRAKNHYDPLARLDLDGSATGDQSNAEEQLQIFKDNFSPLNSRMAGLMYFS